MKDEQPATEKSTAENDMAVRNKRLMALSMSVAAVLIAGIIIGMMLAIHFAEPMAPPDSERMRALRTALAEDSDNASTRAALRDEDLRLREQYVANRRRFQTGAWVFLAGVVLSLLSLKWYMSLDPKNTRPSLPKDRQDANQWGRSRKRAWLLSCLVGGAVVVVLVVMGIVGGPRVSNLPPQGGVDISHEGSVESPTTSDDSSANPPAYDENWPWFRGPTGMGIVAPDEWPVTWNGATGENIAWSVNVPTPGKSSPIVWEDMIFLSGATETEQNLFCFNRATGEELWRTTIAPPRPPGHEYDIMEDTGYAAITPATDGKRVYVMYASADIAAVDFDGNIAWSRNLGLPESLYGLATSLLIHGGKVLVQFDRGSSADENLSALLALDTATGATVWSKPRPVDNGWSSPLLAHTPERDVLILSGDPWVIAYDPKTGNEYWRVSGMSGDVAPSPVYANGLFFITSEYAKAMAIRAGGTGDVTDTHVVWTSIEGLSDASSPIADNELFLQVHSSSQITCLDARNGEIAWQEFLESEFWASPILAGKTVYLCGYDGKTYIFNLTREYSLIDAPDIGEPISASPAFLDGQIFIRGKQRLFCIDRPAETK